MVASFARLHGLMTIALLIISLPGSRAQETDSLYWHRSVDSLILLSRTWTDQGLIDNAYTANMEAMQLVKENAGEESLVFAAVAFNTGRIYAARKEFADAEIWYTRSLTLRRRIAGNPHLEYVKTASNLAGVYREIRQFEKAESLYKEADSLVCQIKGKNDVFRSGILNNLAFLYYLMGKIQDAEIIYLEAIAIWKNIGREGSPENIQLLQNLGNLYVINDKYYKAEQPLLLAASLLENQTAERGKEWFSVQESLAGLYWSTEQLTQARDLYNILLARCRDIWGDNHIRYATLQANLAEVHMDLGDYPSAEAGFTEALARFQSEEENLPHPEYLSCLNSMANLFRNLGQYGKAESYYRQVIMHGEEWFGKPPVWKANTLNDLAILYRMTGRTEEAESLYKEYLDLLASTSGTESTDYSNGLNNLGNLYLKSGKLDRAEPAYRESIAIRERIVGKNHSLYANSLYSLGQLSRMKGDFTGAETLLLEARSIQESVLGSDHRETAFTWESLADLYAETGRYEKADTCYRELTRINKSILLKVVQHLSERELDQYLHQFAYIYDKVLAFLHRTEQIGMVDEAYNNSLFYKGFLLQSQNMIRHLALHDTLANAKISHWMDTNRRLATLLALPVAERDSTMVAELEEKANSLEKELIRSVAGYADVIRQVNWQEIIPLLKQDEAAIEFINMNTAFLKPSDSILYAALLIKPGLQQPLFIPIFEVKELDHLLFADKERKADYVNELYTRNDRGMVELGSEKKSLYELIWAKIEAAGLDEIKTIYYSPSGVLHRLNLGAIAVDDETILSDRYNMVAMNSTRQLVIPSTVITGANDALLIGGVNFEADSIQSTLDEQPLLASRSTADAWTESGTRGGSWSYLKWTEKEVDRIVTTLTSSNFNTLQYTGSDATEEVIKSIGLETASPRILHIATHGFFFPDPKISTQGIELLEEEPVFEASDNPMIRSGLILAGGNYAWQHGRAPSPDMEDGILTAYEISQMNLSNTELVVLSACETGLGDIQGNEGVYGLQRAFKIAGAKYLIMSLWQVPDRETMEFMTTLYRNWLEEKLTIPDAFRKTQLEMRDRFFNPYSWAGFVLVE